MVKERGSRPTKTDERWCGRRIRKTTRQAGSPDPLDVCPVHTASVVSEVARLSYQLRKRRVPASAVKGLKAVRRLLRQLIPRIRPPHAPPSVTRPKPCTPSPQPNPSNTAVRLGRVGLGHPLRRPIDFVPQTEAYAPKSQPPAGPRTGMIELPASKALDYSVAAIGSPLESFGVQAYLEECEEVLGKTSERSKEVEFDEDMYILCSADPVVQRIAVGTQPAGYAMDEDGYATIPMPSLVGKLVLKHPQVVRKLLDELRSESSEFDSHTLRRTLDVVESHGFLTPAMIGRSFRIVDGVPVLVE